MIPIQDLATAFQFLQPGAKFVFWEPNDSQDTRGYDNLQTLDVYYVYWFPTNPNPMPTLEQVQAIPATIIATIEFEGSGTPLLAAFIDNVAQQKQYADALSCASYINSSNNQWKSEATTFVAWRDSVYTYVLAQFALMQSGARTIPTYAEFQTELPVITWPD